MRNTINRDPPQREVANEQTCDRMRLLLSWIEMTEHYISYGMFNGYKYHEDLYRRHFNAPIASYQATIKMSERSLEGSRGHALDLVIYRVVIRRMVYHLMVANKIRFIDHVNGIAEHKELYLKSLAYVYRKLGEGL